MQLVANKTEQDSELMLNNSANVGSGHCTAEAASYMLVSLFILWVASNTIHSLKLRQFILLNVGIKPLVFQGKLIQLRTPHSVAPHSFTVNCSHTLEPVRDTEIINSLNVHTKIQNS